MQRHVVLSLDDPALAPYRDLKQSNLTRWSGRFIAEGDKVVLYYAAANRDEDVFADPHTFDVGRTPNDHVTFGPGGPHFCLGAHLARLETKILFQELLPRLKSIELAGPVERIRSNFVNGIKRMPVRVELS